MKKLLLPLLLCLAVALFAACTKVGGKTDENSENLTGSENAIEQTTETDTTVESETDKASETDSEGETENESKPAYQSVDPIEDGGDYGFNK